MTRATVTSPRARPPLRPCARPSDDALEVQLSRLREVTGEERLRIAGGLTAAARQLVEAGMAARYPHDTPRQRFLRLALMTLGRDLAIEVYPEAASLEP